MKSILRVFSFLVLISFTHMASAQIVFTVTATTSLPFGGYIPDKPYTFTFTLGNFTTLSSSVSTSDNTRYLEETITDDQFWAALGGNGLVGTFVRPTGASSDPYSGLITAIPPFTSTNAIGLYATTERAVTQTIGFTTPSGTNISAIYVDINDAALPTWAMTNDGNPTSVTPENYFSAYVGNTYSGFIGTTDNVTLYDEGGDEITQFTVASLTIGSAVPEPSTYAAMFGVAALAFTAWRRRRLKA